MLHQSKNKKQGPEKRYECQQESRVGRHVAKYDVVAVLSKAPVRLSIVELLR